MLQIRLSKPANESDGVAKWLPPETVTVACPDHLVLSDLPVAKSLGTVNPASMLKTVGRRSRRQLGERVHFCVRCDFPIAVYGRLDDLSKKKLQLANQCYFCHKHTESVNYLLLHCPTASDLWNMFCYFFGLSWVMAFSVRDAVESWSSREVDKAIKSMSMMIPAAIFWCYGWGGTKDVLMEFQLLETFCEADV